MIEETETTNEVFEPQLCDGCVAIPLSVLGLEIPMPIAGWEQLFAEHKVKIVTDFLGRKAVAAAAARRLLSTLRRQQELRAEDAQRRSKELAARHPVRAGGLPRVEGLSPFESVIAAGGIVTPEQEFGGRPKPRFLQDELAAGERALAEKQRLAAERSKERLADQMRDKLGGKT